ncbi:hypothetical protein MPSEU_000479400 [Mayamaea pseudoterrestris]|nr:hypothetical protein MPSEU_000479400 [Mayamaea pseudoterrestris]
MNSTEERCLWKRTMSPETLRRNDSAETLASMQARFASTPPKLSFWQLCSRSHVVVQEISITAYLLTRHRLLIEMKERQFTIDSRRNSASSCFIVVALLVVLFFGSRGESAQDRRAKVTQRATDGLLSATLLRLMASFLQSLTASYASDTLYTLAVAGLALHILACDYSYANGRNHNSSKKNHVMNALGRPLFHGGTVSLNSALFSTMLLVSRLDTSEAYFFIYFAIVLFAFYPVSRNSITASFPAHDNGEKER